ncbi:MAG TPA: serine hydrolase domain-containing protein [Thermomicrobiales bacterium]|jgi:CubicO group peptidase (beta-lactamase class C family)
MRTLTLSRALIAIALAVVVALLGTLTMPRPPSLSTNVTGDPQLAARARPLLTGALDRVSVASIEGDKVTYAHFGASETTQYEIGSITKTFTSLLLADAIKRGEVKAETRVGELLPLDGAAVADVTLAELASHRSGLPRLATRPQDVLPSYLLSLIHKDPYVQDVAGLVEQARSAALTDRGQFRYSNLGAALLGQALAAATRLDYAQLVQERIFKPLGMTASLIPVRAENLPGDAPTGYSVSGKDEAAWTLNGSAPAGGIRSTPADMARYAQALLDGTAPGMAALTPQWAADEQRIGLAWLTEEVDGKTLTWHNGGTGGFASAIFLDRANGRAIIILSNTAASVTNAGETLITGAGE